MRLPLISAALALALMPVAAHGQAADEPEFSASEVRAHVEFLADDLLEGRNAGTRGYDIAARYVATRFDALGLKPGGTDGSWYQQVPLAEYEIDASKPASVTIGAQRFVNGKNVLIAANPRYGNDTQTVTAGAVFVGFGLEAPDAGFDDYTGLDVRGKFAVVLMGLPKGLSSGTISRLREDRARIAGRHGAIGILYVVSPETEKQFPWSYANDYILRKRTDWLGPQGFVGGEDPGVSTGAYLRADAVTPLFAGAKMRAEQVFAAAGLENVALRGFALPGQVSVSRTSKVKQYRSPNVIGVLPGSDPRLASEYVVLSAHLDHEGTDTALKGDQIYNGAMDNAAGTATMLEAARAFVQSGVRPKRSILFVSLTAEEDGLLGSDYLAHNPVVGAGKLVADVNLDMPILLYDFQDVVAFGAEHSTLGPIVARAGAKMGVTLSPDPMPEEQLFVRSDHYSFVKTGVPSVFLVTGFKNGGEKAFRDFLANHYHKVSDQVDLPFDWAAGAKFARINYLIAREIADADEAPRWYEGNAFGDQYAPDAPKAPRPGK